MNLADRIYQDFCESDAPSDEPLTSAWYAYENEFGEIQSNSLVDKLVFAAIQHTIQAIKDYDENGA